jgi:sirohydrochlorin cobaltochelatase
VIRDDFTDAVLVVMGHGTTKNEDSAAPVYQHAAELRRRGIFREVREAFWKQEPHIKEVLESLSAPRVFIAPLFISEGYFSDQVIPETLGFAESRVVKTPHSTLHYCGPVGTHPSMTQVVLARAKDIVAKYPFPRAPQSADITLFIAGHGTERNKKSREAIERQVELVRAMNLYADVQAIYLDEEPRIQNYHELAKTRNVVVMPFFISDGMHTQEDIPMLLGEAARIVKERLAAGRPTWRNPTEKHGKLVWYSPAVGTDPGIADVIFERVKESLQR